MTFKEFVKSTFREKDFIRPCVICKDGFYMSVQGSHGHACTPRQIADEYSHMEVANIPFAEPLLIPYSDRNPNFDCITYGYVPVQVIQEVIFNHGGIDNAATFSKEQ